MSELWFRAYHKEYGMIYPDEYFSLEDAIRGDLTFFGSPAKDYNVEDFIFMQSTNIEDKHGTMIYESDIVRHDAISVVGVVIRSAIYPGFVILSPSKTGAYVLHDEWEEIGNTWENSDLLPSSSLS